MFTKLTAAIAMMIVVIVVTAVVISDNYCQSQIID